MPCRLQFMQLSRSRRCKELRMLVTQRFALTPKVLLPKGETRSPLPCPGLLPPGDGHVQDPERHCARRHHPAGHPHLRAGAPPSAALACLPPLLLPPRRWACNGVVCCRAAARGQARMPCCRAAAAIAQPHQPDRAPGQSVLPASPHTNRPRSPAGHGAGAQQGPEEPGLQRDGAGVPPLPR